MRTSKYAKEIEGLVDELNRRTGDNYMTDYCPQFGGWNLHHMNTRSGIVIGFYGFEGRKESKVMVEYLRTLLKFAKFS